MKYNLFYRYITKLINIIKIKVNNYIIVFVFVKCNSQLLFNKTM